MRPAPADHPADHLGGDIHHAPNEPGEALEHRGDRGGGKGTRPVWHGRQRRHGQVRLLVLVVQVLLVLGGTTCSALLEERSCVAVHGGAVLAPHEPPTAPRARTPHRLLLLLLSMLLLLLLLGLPCRRRCGTHALVSYSDSRVSPSGQSQSRPMIAAREFKPLRGAPERVVLGLVLLVAVHEPGVLEERSVLVLLRCPRRWRLPSRGRTTRGRLAR